MMVAASTLGGVVRRLQAAVVIAAMQAGLLGLIASSAGARAPSHVRAQRAAVKKGKAISLTLARTVGAEALPPPEPPEEPYAPEPDVEGPKSRNRTRTDALVEFGAPGGAARNTGVRSRARARAASLELSFLGLDRVEAGGVPPDTNVAANAATTFEVTNNVAEVLDHNGPVIKTFDLGKLFTGKGGEGSDPKIVYDAETGFYFVSYISELTRPVGRSVVSLAVTSDPVAGSWHVYTASVSTGLQDQPKLAVTAQHVLIGWNEYGAWVAAKHPGQEEPACRCESNGSRLVVGDKSAITAAKATAAGVRFTTPWGAIPAIQSTPAPQGYVVFHAPGASSLPLWTCSGELGKNYGCTSASLAIKATGAPPPGVQPPAVPEATELDAGDDRLDSAAVFENDLWVSGGDKCKIVTDTAARACVRLINIDPSVPSLKADVDAILVGGYSMYPAVTIDRAKNLWIALSTSSRSQFATSGIAEIPGGVIKPVIPLTNYRAGTGSINCGATVRQNRFGDYSGISFYPGSSLPNDREGIWAATELGLAGCEWWTGLAFVTP
jgi:hypothetical protein